MDSAKFWRCCMRSEEGCLLWMLAVGKGGYGNVWFGGKYVNAHRLAWTLTHGPVPAGMLVCHKCDNHRCVDPEHLFLGSQLENMADMVAKGRQKKSKKNEQRVVLGTEQGSGQRGKRSEGFTEPTLQVQVR